MVVLCTVTHVYYLINNTMALPFSSAAYQAVGSPLPSFITSQCCSTVINGCGVPYTASQLGLTFSTAPLASTIPGFEMGGGPAIQWNTLSAPNSLTGLLQGASYASGGNILAAVNGQFYLNVSGARGWVLHNWMPAHATSELQACCVTHPRGPGWAENDDATSFCTQPLRHTTTQRHVGGTIPHRTFPPSPYLCR